ncbi:hypothetical protein GIV23_12075 [Pseudomonas sp. PA-1-2A]|uniref:Uncharacterized protein n=1 Tax=Pseudomonas lactis TaxID=1615674 RepID=A0ABS9FL17_9PSED|nr:MULTISPECIES: hypothetical protein [Pseudomonas]MBI6975095.1 hypothetical protein [Pseudomonas lactis]MCF4974175.1 hypothetical protein [Pseudomonas lactis]MCF5003910.1 hypothetical protein [Pseudomonas lactis]MCF5009207.1 hypothetical protein [Pseudomonas lactis]MCF5014669.1 hypothetical protein [Pseudomonas lactis]
MISNHLSLVEQHRQDAYSISERTAEFLAAGGTVAQLPSPPRKPLPPPRSTKIDPETILKRRKPPITATERKALRKLAEGL